MVSASSEARVVSSGKDPADGAESKTPGICSNTKIGTKVGPLKRWRKCINAKRTQKCLEPPASQNEAMAGYAHFGAFFEDQSS